MSGRREFRTFSARAAVVLLLLANACTQDGSLSTEDKQRDAAVPSPATSGTMQTSAAQPTAAQPPMEPATTLPAATLLDAGANTAPTAAATTLATQMLPTPTPAQDAGLAAEPSLRVTQITTITTVQSSEGVFLSPLPLRRVPPYVHAEAGSAGGDVGSARSQVDLALLFNGDLGQAPLALEARVNLEAVSGLRAAAATLTEHFPRLTASAAGEAPVWRIGVASQLAPATDSQFPEWSGWQSFGGLQVSEQDTDVFASAATLSLAATEISPSLTLSLSGTDVLITNQSAQAFEQVLLVKSHAGGVGITVLDDLGPDVTLRTKLGPKEDSAGDLLDAARQALFDFFAGRVGTSVAEALTSTKSVPFLENHGLRLIGLYASESASAVQLAGESPAQVVVAHSEILLEENEAAALELLQTADITAEDATAALGRFTRAKLEQVALTADSAAAETALELLQELGPQ